MTILNNQKTIEFLYKWLGNYSKKYAIKVLIVPYENTYASFLTTYLCLESRRISNTSVITVRNDENITVPFIDVTNYISNVHKTCLRLAENSGIIVSPITATRAELIRNYNKYTDAADLYPLLYLLDSDIENLSKELPNCPHCPTFDKDTEWAMGENFISKIISGDDPPHQNKYWFRYTIDQKQIISKLYTRYHATNHKSLKSVNYPILPNNLVVNKHIIGAKNS